MPTQPTGSPNFYKVMGAVLLLISGVLFWAAIRQHAWFYWAFAIITLVNAIMTVMKYFAVLEQNKNG